MIFYTLEDQQYRENQDNRRKGKYDQIGKWEMYHRI